MYDAFRNGTPTQYTNPRTGLKKDTKDRLREVKLYSGTFFISIILIMKNLKDFH